MHGNLFQLILLRNPWKIKVKNQPCNCSFIYTSSGFLILVHSRKLLHRNGQKLQFGGIFGKELLLRDQKFAHFLWNLLSFLNDRPQKNDNCIGITISWYLTVTHHWKAYRNAVNLVYGSLNLTVISAHDDFLKSNAPRIKIRRK